MPFVGILALAINRLRSRLGLTLLSLLGVALVVALAASIPIFTQAVSFTVMLDELNELAQITKRPPFAIRLYVVASERQPLPLATARDFVPLVTQTMSERLGLLPKNVTLSVETFSLSLRPVPGDETYGANVEELQEVILAIYPGIEEHIVISEGEPYGEITQGERLAVWVHDVMAEAMGLRVGEAYDVLDKGTGYLFPVYIAGFWHARAYPDAYWYDNPASVLSKALLMTPATFTAKVEPYLPEATGLVTWYLVFSEETIDTRRVERIADGIRQAANLLSMHMPGLRMDYSPLQPIERYFQRKTTLLALLVGFSLPAFGLLLYFMTLISAVTVTFQREEMAILSSRGVGRQPLSVTAFVETLLLLVAGTPVGLIGGLIIARLMGNTKSFLTFTVRPPLPVSFYGIDGRLLAGVLLALLVARLLPTWRAASTSIVGHLTERSRQVSGSLWPKLAVDLPLLLTCFYTYQRLKVRGSFGVVGWEPSGDPFRDPLLLLTPTLFVFTVCLVATHLFPFVLRLGEVLGRLTPSFAVSFGLHQLARQSGQYTHALFLTLVCLSLGAFYSSLAQSLDAWLRDHVYYQVGADYTFTQGVRLDTATESASGGIRVLREGGWLLPISDYQALPGVQAATRVGEFTAIVQQSVPAVAKGRLLGIDRLDFPHVAFYRADFSRVPLADLLNRLGMYDNGILVSEQFLQVNGLAEGMVLNLDLMIDMNWYTIPFVVVGTFDYFPTMFPKKGQVFVGNLDYIFEYLGGVYPHSIWMRIAPDVDMTVLTASLERMGVIITHPADARVMMRSDEERSERVGLFGVLSVGFAGGCVLSLVGLLLYSFASLQQRLGLMGVLRAIGATVHSVIFMAGVEYGGVVSYGILVGVGIGVIASYLFVPFFHFSTDPTMLAPPFVTQVAWAKTGIIALCFTLTTVSSQLVILYRLTQRDAFQALRLGQHQ